MLRSFSLSLSLFNIYILKKKRKEKKVFDFVILSFDRFVKHRI